MILLSPLRGSLTSPTRACLGTFGKTWRGRCQDGGEFSQHQTQAHHDEGQESEHPTYTELGTRAKIVVFFCCCWVIGVFVVSWKLEYITFFKIISKYP